MLEARHGGHHHSNDHAKTGLLFLACVLSVMVLYSIMCLIYGRLRPKRPFDWPRPPLVIAGVWIVLVLAAFIRHHDFDSIAWAARRAGRIGFAAAVFSQFLILKPSVLPRTYIVGLTFCHKWAGRTAVGLALVHGVLYTIAYIKHDTFSKLFTVLDNVWGIVALVCYILMGVLSLKFIRRRQYNLFYVPHVPLSFAATVLVLLHARPSAAILCEVSFFLFLMAIVLRVSTSRGAALNVATVSPSYDVVVLDRSTLSSEFPAGSHVRVNTKISNPKSWLTPSHPYTIASLASDQDIKLVVKRTRWQLKNAESYSIQGPFLCPYDPTNFTKVIAIGGGAGISFIAPVWRAAAATGTTRVKAVWITRSKEDTNVLPQIGLEECDVYITRGQFEPSVESIDSPDPSAFELDDLEPEEDNAQLLPKDNQPLGQGITQHKGRPVFSEAFDVFIGDTLSSDVSVIACGPESLIRDVKAWAKSQRYNFFAEEYST